MTFKNYPNNRDGETYIGFEVYRLAPGESISVSSEGKETVAIVLEGTCNISVGNECFERVGRRQSVFDAVPPEAVYSPPGHVIGISGLTAAEVAVAMAPATEGSGGPRLIGAEDIPSEKRTRRVNPAIHSTYFRRTPPCKKAASGGSGHTCRELVQLSTA